MNEIIFFMNEIIILQNNKIQMTNLEQKFSRLIENPNFPNLKKSANVEHPKNEKIHSDGQNYWLLTKQEKHER